MSSVVNAVGDVVGGIGDAVGGVVKEVGKVGQGVIDTAQSLVKQVEKNPLTAAALIAGGYAFAPELGAWLSSDGTALAGTAEGVTAGTVPTTQAALTSTAAPAAVAPAVADLAPAIAPTVAPAVASTAAPTTLADLGSLGSGTFATPGDLGTQFVTQGALNPAPAVGQLTGGAALTPAAVAGTGAAAQGLLGAATDATGAVLPATAGGAGAGTAAAGASAINDALAGSAVGGAAANALGGAAGNPLSSMLPYLAAGNVASSLIGANAAQNAANVQAAAANRGVDLQKYIFDTINQQQAPYRTAGYNALNQIQGQMPYLTQQFTPQDFAAGIDPGYAFRLQQGQMAAQRAGNVKGMTGNVLTGLQDYTQGLASQEYQNAFNRFQTQRGNIYNTLAGIAGIGQTGQTATNTAAGNYGTNVANLLTGGASAQAAGQIGQANALAGGLGNVMNTYTLASLLNQNPSVA
jgi:uncharacterized protein YukE